jgi:predicted RNA methylase
VNHETQQLAERLMDSALRDSLRERRVADLPAGEGR